MRKWVKSSALWFTIFIAVIGLAGCGTGPKEAPASSQAAASVELTVSAAASLTDAMEEIGQAYESGHASVKLNFNFGASGALQQQIEQGAPVDVFVSAASQNMDALVDRKLVDPDQRKTLLTNTLVVVIPADGQTPIGQLAELTKAEVRRVAIGIPDSVPAGGYAKEVLENAKLWDALQAKTVQAKDVRQVLQYVETGNADAGFVYKTDAMTSQKVKIAFEVDPGTYTPIEYPAGVVKATKHRQEAEDFYAYLQSDEARQTFAKYGFSVPG